MSTLSVQIHVGNDAFSGDDLGPECARILRSLARKIEGHARGALTGTEDRFALSDVNGNKVGVALFDIEGEDDSNFVENMTADDICEVLREFCPNVEFKMYYSVDRLADLLILQIRDGVVTPAQIRHYFGTNRLTR